MQYKAKVATYSGIDAKLMVNYPRHYMVAVPVVVAVSFMNGLIFLRKGEQN